MCVTWPKTVQNTRGPIKMETGMIPNSKVVSGNARNAALGITWTKNTNAKN